MPASPLAPTVNLAIRFFVPSRLTTTVLSYQGPRRRILVVDDEPLNRAILRELLSAVGFDAVEADSPEQALALIQDGFDAVISDIPDARLRRAHILPESQIAGNDEGSSYHCFLGQCIC
jgi:PleD family two-component response regulator